jgi:hypothetical protein
MDLHGRTFCEEAGIAIDRNTPSVLFRWLCASVLFSARIGASTATAATKALADSGWTTARKMADSTWDERVRVLNGAGYARYDESTARMLGENAERVAERYGGDLRRLRSEADKDPEREQELLRAFKGLGPVGVGIFCREVQTVWPELHPFVDRKSLEVARKLGLAHDARALARLVDRQDLPRLLAALVRTGLGHDVETVLSRAGLPMRKD